VFRTWSAMKSTRDHFAKRWATLPSTEFGKTLALNAQIRLV
jgi:hypothetical protein